MNRKDQNAIDFSYIPSTDLQSFRAFRIWYRASNCKATVSWASVLFILKILFLASQTFKPSIYRPVSPCTRRSRKLQRSMDRLEDDYGDVTDSDVPTTSGRPTRVRTQCADLEG